MSWNSKVKKSKRDMKKLNFLKAYNIVQVYRDQVDKRFITGHKKKVPKSPKQDEITYSIH